MTTGGPGGREVGRVSLRVVPDVSRFKRQVEQELRGLEANLPVKPDVDLDEITKQLRTYRPPTVRVPARVDLDRRMLRSLNLGELGVRTNLDVEVNRDRIQRTVNDAVRGVRSPKIEVELDIDRGLFTRTIGLFSGLFAASNNVTRGLSSMADGAVTLVGAVAGLGSTLGRLIPTTTSLGGNLIALVASVTLLMSAMGALAVVGGTLVGVLMAIGGAIGAAFAGAPVMLTALLAPIGAIAMGMDGIKRAMEPLNDEFETMKAGVEGVFEEGLRPVFEELQAIMPTVQTGMMGVSAALVNMAQAMVPILTSPEAIDQVASAFAGVNYMLLAATEPAKGLLAELLKIAGTTELYMIFGDMIASIIVRMTEFLQSVTAVNQGTSLLTSTMQGLAGILDEATGTFLSFLEAGMEFLNTAAPGLEAFFAGMTGFFGAVDWASLGDSFGRIFGAIGDGLERVPPDTWERLAIAVDEFATTIEDMIASGALTALIDFFIESIHWFNAFIEGASRAAGAVMLLYGSLTGQWDVVVQGWMLMTNALSADADRMATELPAKMGAAGQGVTSQFQAGISPLPPAAAATGQQTASSLTTAMGGMPGAVGSLAVGILTRAQSGIAPMPGIFQSIGTTAAGWLYRAIYGGQGPTEAAARANKDAANRGLNRMPGDFDRLGDSAVDGLVAAIYAGQTSIASAAKAVALIAFNTAMSALGAASPSRLFMRAGDAMVQGIIVGLRRATPELERRLAELAQRLYDATANITVPEQHQEWYEAGRDRLLAFAEGLRDGSIDIDRWLDRWLARHVLDPIGRPVANPGQVHRIGPEERQALTASDIAEAINGMEFVIDSRGGEVIARWVNKEQALAMARI